jgi:hypothetical protein
MRSLTTPGGQNASSKWRIAVADVSQFDDPRTRALTDDGMAAAPHGFLREDSVEMLPRTKVVGDCRLCGVPGELTKEHIPPASSGNKERHSSHSFEEWVQANSLEIPASGRINQGGIFGYTLCAECNSLTGTLYGAEYQKWTAATLGAIGAMPKPSELDNRVGRFAWALKLGDQETCGVKPGAFVRQVLSMMCSLSGTWDLSRRHPEVRRIVLQGSTEPLPSNLALGAALFLGPRIRIMGPQLHVQPGTGSWRWLMEVAYPPFAFILSLASNMHEPVGGLMMTDWVGFSSADEQFFQGDFEVGFGWTPYPGDYRSNASITAGVPI